MVVSELKLYELLKSRLGTEEAEAFVSLLDTKVERKFEEKKEVLATKGDLHEFEVRVNARFSEMQRSMYLVSVGQYLAVVGSILAILMFMKNFM